MQTVMVVDDAKDTQMLLEFDLSSAGYHVITADSGEDAHSKLTNSSNIDLVLLDMYMPGESGLATLEKLKSQDETKDLPVIMLSASDKEDEVVQALELGASDYVTKPYIAKVLLARIRTALRLREKTQQLEKLARIDHLTKVNNRGSFEELSEKLIVQCHRYEQELSIAMFDIDFFKAINDEYGHEAGDKVLIEFAEQLTATFRECDVIGRIGGEEFAVCMPNTPIEQAYIACERLRTSVEKTAVHYQTPTNITINLTVSCGLASTAAELFSLAKLLRQADIGLYQAKNTGRNNTVNANTIEPAVDMFISELENTGTDAGSESKYPGIDFEIGVNNVLGDESLFQEILVMFYQDHHLDEQKIKDALSVEDFLLAKHLSHTLKGVSASIGAMSLYEVCQQLDNALNEQQEHLYQPLFADTSKELKLVLDGVEKKFADKLAS